MVSSSNAIATGKGEGSREKLPGALPPYDGSALFLVDFKIQNDVLAGVETGNCSRCGLCIVLLGVQFVVRIGVESAESVVACIVGITASHGVGPHVLQENNASGERVVGFVAYHATDSAKLRFALFVLTVCGGRQYGDSHQKAKEASCNLHLLSPFIDCIRKTTVSSLPPPFASIVRV